LALLFCRSVLAQPSVEPDTLPAKGFVVVDTILIEGNKKTKASIIYRELLFRQGDTINLDHLMELIAQSSQNLQNTRLFNEAIVKITRWRGTHIEITIALQERWYIIPGLIFELADRNFNVWWVEQDHDFRRTIYGLQVYHNNVRGRNEQIFAIGTLGYTQQLWLQYSIPYINRQQRLGLQFTFHCLRNKEVAFNTRNDKQQFVFVEERFILQNFMAKAGVTHRKAIHNTHLLEMGYHHNLIEDTVRELNSDYLLHNQFLQRYVVLNYLFTSDHKDNRAYPLRGYYVELQAQKKGLGLFKEANIFNLFATFSKYFDLGRQFYVSTQLRGKLSFPREQPYFNQVSLGFERDLVRGYEYYRIDGRMFGLAKVNLKRHLFSFVLDNSRFSPWEQVNKIPFVFYLKTYADLGYVKDDFFQTNNSLSNTLLLGWGAGLDISTYYDITFRLEYSFNKMLEHSLFLHFIMDL